MTIKACIEQQLTVYLLEQKTIDYKLGFKMKKILLVLLLTLSSAINAEDINLNYGDVHLNDSTGIFATKLDGDFTIVVNVVYEDESMSAVIINNETGETHCLPHPCNYNK